MPQNNEPISDAALAELRRQCSITQAEHRQPRVYVKPPESQSLQRARKAEKVAEYMPVLDTEAEKNRVAILLEKARREREECHISRFLDDRYCVLDGRR